MPVGTVEALSELDTIEKLHISHSYFPDAEREDIPDERKVSARIFLWNIPPYLDAPNEDGWKLQSLKEHHLSNWLKQETLEELGLRAHTVELDVVSYLESCPKLRKLSLRVLLNTEELFPALSNCTTLRELDYSERENIDIRESMERLFLIDGEPQANLEKITSGDEAFWDIRGTDKTPEETFDESFRSRLFSHFPSLKSFEFTYRILDEPRDDREHVIVIQRP